MPDIGNTLYASYDMIFAVQTLLEVGSLLRERKMACVKSVLTEQVEASAASGINV